MAQQAALEAAELREELRLAKDQPELAQLASRDRVPKAELPESQFVQFGFDSSVIDDSGQTVIAEVIQKLDEDERLFLQLRGFADSKGNSAYNAILSSARATNVKDALVESGIDERRITTLAFGESMATDDATPAELRRVEVRFR